MAEPNLNSEQRARAYLLLFRLNRSFHLIVQRLHDAKELNIITTQDAKDMLGLVQEDQLEINLAVLHFLETFEDRDHHHFGKVRTAMEKRLKS
jgi:hypothetical protein